MPSMTYTGPIILKHPIARYVYQNVGDVEHSQGDVELVARKLEVCDQAIDLGVSDIRSVDEG